MAIISEGITLSYKASGDSYTVLTNLQEIPELGVASVESIEVTTLADAHRVYTDGLLSYGDALAFKFLYDKAQFTSLADLEGAQDWKVTLPDNATCAFSGGCSVKLDGVGVNSALTYTLTIKPNSAMVWA